MFSSSISPTKKEILQEAEKFRSANNVLRAIIPRVKNFEPNNEEHNASQPLECIQFEFEYRDDAQAFIRTVKQQTKEKIFGWCGEGKNKQYVVQIKVDFFSTLWKKNFSQKPLEIKPQKFEIFPTVEQGNWLLFSMQDIDKIKNYLKNFPQNKLKAGCSSTLVWSGIKGNNVPVECYERRTIGFVLNPDLIDIPQADFIAFGSGSELSVEIKKTDAKEEGIITKYPNKQGYMRLDYVERHSGKEFFITNAARNEHIPGEKKASIYHPEGSGETFSKNVWRKYFKYKKEKIWNAYVNNDGVAHTNEAIVFQKKDLNPIDGLFITKLPTEPKDRYCLNEILKNYPRLKLFLYDIKANEHIIRYIDNSSAQKFLHNSLNFEEMFRQAKPFKGFKPRLDPEPSFLSSFLSMFSVSNSFDSKKLPEKPQQSNHKV